MSGLEATIKTQPKEFWNDIACRRSNRSGTELFTFQDQVCTSPIGVAESFATYFSSVFGEENAKLSLTSDAQEAEFGGRVSYFSKGIYGI